MKLFKRGPTRLERQLAAANLEIAIGRAEAAPAAQYDRVCTPKGRRAHLRHPDLGVLCGWPGAEDTAGPSLPLCRLCADSAGAVAELEAS